MYLLNLKGLPGFGGRSVCWFTLQMVAAIRAGLIQSGSQQLLLGLHAGTGTHGLEPSSIAFPGHKQGARSEVEPLGLKLAHIWDTSTLKSSF